MVLYLHNKKHMKNILFIVFFLFHIGSFSQESTESNRGTIKVQKKGNVFAVIFDNVNNRLVGKDEYGNILDSAVVSFHVMITIQGIAYEETVVGTTLSRKMQNQITRVDRGTTLFFTDIKVKEKSGQTIDWPKFNTKIGFSFEKEE